MNNMRCWNCGRPLSADEDMGAEVCPHDDCGERQMIRPFMRTITRRLEIDAGHRLMNHESKCRNVHGHRYVFEVTVGAENLDGSGRVIDFGVVKQELGGWLDEHWDHGFIYQRGDPVGEAMGNPMLCRICSQHMSFLDGRFQGEWATAIQCDSCRYHGPWGATVTEAEERWLRIQGGEAMKTFVLDVAPSAENLSEFFHGIAEGLLHPHGVQVINVRLHETPNCYADSKDHRGWSG